MLNDLKCFWSEGCTRWCDIRGELHRLDGPAVIYDNGEIQWWVDGKLHRLDGPAIEQTNGQKEWWVDGELHRSNGPAIERNDYRKWYVNGKLHRLDGPAIEYVSGLKEWCISGEYVSKQDFNSAVISFLLNCDKKNALVLRNIIQTHREHDV